jgi:tetratricopeptide (TPR) repeat protein
MRLAILVALLLAAAPAWAAPADRTALARARTAYNAGRYDAAIGAARNVLNAGVDVRGAGDVHDLGEAREVLRATDPSNLSPGDRGELLVGLGQWLFFTERFGPAAELFEVAVARPLTGGNLARDRVLDWWASALDREAQDAPAARDRIYSRVYDRMEKALEEDPGSVAANYWLVASARAIGDLDRAWQAAMAAWVRSMLAPDRGGALRADLDRLVLTSIIPERARETSSGNEKQAADTMVTAWEQFKTDWEGGAPASAAASPQESAPRR